jgi:hypothetical protein
MAVCKDFSCLNSFEGILFVMLSKIFIVLVLPVGENPEQDRLKAAARLVENAQAVVKFAARGCGQVQSNFSCQEKCVVAKKVCEPTALPERADTLE